MQLIKLIEQATGRAIYTVDIQDEGGYIEADEDTIEAN